ncbi:hypothetical protein HHS34_010410 [Acidithiobacillus montserratensis]|uniref:Uncharacterized protein n=1 Tax=Acidithiobacillus montserratensis TaxID=2729135 RepID=A0ACD5HCX1_9PROT|nr:hypothetical protein [Acidithiobacillus montserratensis]MBU2747473.1 hypothetical protein [Acidithiobacillus montserratensis]
MERPKTNTEFFEMMWTYDKERANLEEPVPYRPFRICEYFHDQFGWSGSIIPGTTDDICEDDFSDRAMLTKAYRWYNSVYGDLVQSKNSLYDIWSLSYIPIILGNNAVYSIRIPKIFEKKIIFSIDSDNIENDNGIICEQGQECIYNVLSLVNPLPKGLLPYLDDKELNRIKDTAERFYEPIRWMHSFGKRNEYIDQAFKNYLSSTANIIMQNLSCAKWDASQAAEKIMKGFLKEKTCESKKNHNFEELRETIKRCSMVDVPKYLIYRAYCPAKNRYKNTDLKLAECVDANHAALEIAKILCDYTYSSDSVITC